MFWDEFLRHFADRGLRGTRLIIADESQGPEGCRVHFMRNARACVGKKDRPIVTAALKTAFDQETLAASKNHWATLTCSTLSPLV